MKLARDMSGKELIKQLGKYGYTVTRQTGNHVRLTTNINGEHHVTIPRDKVLRVGTLNNIIKEVSIHLEQDKDEIIKGIQDR